MENGVENIHVDIGAEKVNARECDTAWKTRAREGGLYSAAFIIDFRKSPLIWRGTSHDFVATSYITDNNYYNKSVVDII